MKKLAYVFLISLTAFSNIGYSQTTKGDMEVNAGWGTITGDGVFTVTKLLVTEIITSVFGDMHYTNVRTIGAAFMGYKYYFTDNAAVGMTGTYEAWKADLNYVSNGDKVGEYQRADITIAPELTYNYLNDEWIRLYGSVGIGITFNSEKNTDKSTATNNYNTNDTHLNANLTALGLSAGKALRGNLELGFGYKGLINLGISYIFSNNKKENP